MKKRFIFTIIFSSFILATTILMGTQNNFQSAKADNQTIGGIRCLADSTPVSLTNKKITLVNSASNYVYIQESSLGMKVYTEQAGSLNLGDVVNVNGVLTTLLGGNGKMERVIQASAVSFQSSSPPDSPVYMNEHFVGGSVFCQGQPGEIAAVRDANAPANGLNNIGLLATTYGRVTSMSPTSRLFYIDDESNLATYPDGKIGVMVRYPEPVGSAFAVGDRLLITGVIESYVVPSWNASKRYIEMRTTADLVKY